MASSSFHIASSGLQCFLCTFIYPMAQTRTCPSACFRASAHTTGSDSGPRESFSSAWNISDVFGDEQSLCSIPQAMNQLPCQYSQYFPKSYMNQLHMYIDIRSTISCLVNQILICMSILFWFHRYSTWLYTIMALTTLPQPTPGCTLKGSQI